MSKRFRRSFGAIHHYAWLESDGSLDLPALVGQMTETASAIADSLGMEDLGLADGAWRLFRPLVSTGVIDTVMLLESYDDIRVWAAGEYAAQRSPDFMEMILAEQDNPHTKIGESHFMAEDSIHDPSPVTTNRICVDWTTFEPTKKAAMIDFPELAAELSEAFTGAGFVDLAVRYFGMLTSAGRDGHLAQLWIEHSSASAMAEALAWRQSDPALGDWRRRLNAVAGDVRTHQLLQQIG